MIFEWEPTNCSKFRYRGPRLSPLAGDRKKKAYVPIMQPIAPFWGWDGRVARD